MVLFHGHLVLYVAAQEASNGAARFGIIHTSQELGTVFLEILTEFEFFVLIFVLLWEAGIYDLLLLTPVTVFMAVFTYLTVNELAVLEFRILTILSYMSLEVFSAETIINQ